MPRKTKQDMIQQIAEQNVKAREVPLGVTVDAFPFTDVTLVEYAMTNEEGWDHYWVTHSGHRHCWSSASVVATFTESARIAKRFGRQPGRFCATCNDHGSHHTDKHTEMMEAL